MWWNGFFIVGFYRIKKQTSIYVLNLLNSIEYISELFLTNHSSYCLKKVIKLYNKFNNKIIRILGRCRYYFYYYILFS